MLVNEMLFPKNYPMNPLLNAKDPMSILEMRLFWLALDDARTQITVRGESCRDGFDALRLLPGQVKRIFANGSYLERLAPACDSLRSWTIDWQDEDGDAVIYKVFQGIQYQAKEGGFTGSVVTYQAKHVSLIDHVALDIYSLFFTKVFLKFIYGNHIDDL